MGEPGHESLVHTLGNLTLTGYNSALSNSDFAVKRPQLATSGVRMNQEIAQQERWGKPQIHARAAALADRVIATWPGPVHVGAGEGSGVAWEVMDRALSGLPAGSWTTYGDLAALIGGHPVAVGARLSSKPVPNAHRVLQVDGSVAPAFRWLDRQRTDKPRDLLAGEGVVFDARDRASAAQRVGTDRLAELAGLGVPERSADAVADLAG